MGILIPNDAYSKYFDYFAACSRLSLVSDEIVPMDLSHELVAAMLTPGIGNGDFSVGDGDPDGRQLTIPLQEGVEATGSGISRHAVLSYWNAVSESWEIRLVTECDERAIDHTKGDKVNLQSFYLHVQGPELVV